MCVLLCLVWGCLLLLFVVCLCIGLFAYVFCNTYSLVDCCCVCMLCCWCLLWLSVDIYVWGVMLCCIVVLVFSAMIVLLQFCFLCVYV